MIRLTTLLCLAALITACSSAKKVDAPIADTYEPLKGAPLNHRYSTELEELRAWQDAKASYEAEYEPEPGTITAGNSVPADRIQEPQPAPLGTSRGDAQIEEDEDSLRIRD